MGGLIRGDVAHTEVAVPLFLIQKDNCHLCDLAWEQLAEAGVADFESLWIDDNADLMARYGGRVPVLRREPDGLELDWPFTADAVRRMLDSQDAPVRA